MENRRKLKTAVMFLIVIFTVPVILLISDKKSFSPEENRNLKSFPDVSAESILDKSFMDGVETYLSDHFPARLGLIKGKLNAERIMGKNCVNGIYITDDRLIEKVQAPDENLLSRSEEIINDFAGRYDSDVFVCIVPTSAGIYRDEIGRFSPQLDQISIIKKIYGGFDEEVSVVDVSAQLAAASDEYIYYRTDHHWTSRGAYTAYKTLIQRLGFSAVSEDRYDIEHVSEEFLGTLYSKCLYSGIKPDVIDIYRCKDGFSVKNMTMNDGIKETFSDDIYFREYLDEKDKYRIFLGENRAFTDITTSADNGRSILIIKDSYANSLVPFLVQHYSRISVVDPRYMKQPLEEYADPNEYDQTLFLYNVLTFSSDGNLKNLKGAYEND